MCEDTTLQYLLSVSCLTKQGSHLALLAASKKNDVIITATGMKKKDGKYIGEVLTSLLQFQRRHNHIFLV